MTPKNKEWIEVIKDKKPNLFADRTIRTIKEADANALEWVKEQFLNILKEELKSYWAYTEFDENTKANLKICFENVKNSLEEQSK